MSRPAQDLQVEECCKLEVGVCDDGDKAGEEDDGEDGAAGGGDTRGVQFAGHVSVAMQDFGDQGISNTVHNMVKQWYKIDRSSFVGAERRTEAISAEFNSQDIGNTMWVWGLYVSHPEICTFADHPREREILRQ